MRRSLVIACILIGVTLAALTILFFVPSSKTCSITCKTDAQCGGTVVSQRFCRDGNVYGSGQANTCVNASTCESVCQTVYGDVLVETCKNDCRDGECV